ncbi:MAG: hypothetical protein IH963_02155 [Chloroflexi bacterium]|nr:hypothetical protein [Chloroflexota bacterium]
MKRYIELVTIAIIFAAVAVSLGGYALGLGPLGVSDVVAQEDHDDDGHDDGDTFGDTLDDHGDGDTFDDTLDDHGDATSTAVDDHDNGHDGDFGGFDQHIDDDGDFIGGTEVFIGNDFQLNAGGMAADLAAGLFFDPTTGQVFDINGVQFFDAVTGEPIDLDLHSEQYASGDFTYGYLPEESLGFRGHIIGGTDIITGGDFQLNAGGMAVDASTGLFLDPTSGQVFDLNGVQFFDPDTGEQIDLDLSSEQYAKGDFTYAYLGQKALGYRSQSVAGLNVFVGGEFQQNAGGLAVDAKEGLFFDPGTGQVFDTNGVQFFDPDTGDEIELDFTAEWYVNGDFTYGFVPEAALGFKPRVDLGFRSGEAVAAYERSVNLTAENILHEGSAFAHDLAEDLDHVGFQDLGPDTVLGIFEAMDHDQFTGLESGQKASMFAAMNGFQIQEFDPGDVAAVAAAMSSQDFTLLDPDSAFGMFNAMGIELSLDLESGALAGMITHFEGSHISELGGDDISRIVGGLAHGQLAGLGDEQALNIALEMNSGHFDRLSPEQVSGLTTGINANDIGALGESVLESIVGSLRPDDFSALSNEKAGKIFQGVGDGSISRLSDEHLGAALDVLDAKFFEAGAAGFSDIQGRVTTFDQVSFETPPALLDLFAGQDLEDFFGGLFGSS